MTVLVDDIIIHLCLNIDVFSTSDSILKISMHIFTVFNMYKCITKTVKQVKLP